MPVNYPAPEGLGLAATQVSAVPPSGSITSHASPTRFASGGWVTGPSGAAQPVNVPEAPTIPRLRCGAGACLSLLPALSTRLADTCVIGRYSATSRQKRKGAALPPQP